VGNKHLSNPSKTSSEETCAQEDYIYFAHARVYLFSPQHLPIRFVQISFHSHFRSSAKKKACRRPRASLSTSGGQFSAHRFPSISNDFIAKLETSFDAQGTRGVTTAAANPASPQWQEGARGTRANERRRGRGSPRGKGDAGRRMLPRAAVGGSPEVPSCQLAALRSSETTRTSLSIPRSPLQALAAPQDRTAAAGRNKGRRKRRKVNRVIFIMNKERKLSSAEGARGAESSGYSGGVGAGGCDGHPPHPPSSENGRRSAQKGG
jgi:hypothetical protein